MNKLIIAGAAVLAVTAGLVRAANSTQALTPSLQAPVSAQAAAPKASPLTPGKQVEQTQQADPVEPAGQEQLDPNEPAGQEQADANEPAEANEPAGPDTDNVQDGPQDGPEDPNEAPETPGK